MTEEILTLPNAETYTIRVPKQIATVKLCKGIIFHIDDTMEFNMPTEAQRKALKETFCIEVIPAEEN